MIKLIVANANNREDTMASSTSAHELTASVRERYAAAAREGGGCCAPSYCGGSDESTVSHDIGYSSVELETLPGGADLGLGCGNPTAIASLSPGDVVLDLGSGAGIDCFLAAQRVGPEGRVVGVDMTPEMLDRARRNAARGGYDNVEFRLGQIEALPVADASIDVVISNCVLNLSTDKPRVLGEIYRVLRPGGRVVVSDLVSSVEVPEALRGDVDALAGCLPTRRQSYLQQFRDAGFHDVRITEEHPYPADYILDTPMARELMSRHEEYAEELRSLAGAIAGAHFEATKS